MKNGTGQLTLILLLMLALFLQIEGVVPDTFAGIEEPLVMTSDKEGLEFSATINDKSFSEKDKLTIAATITNISGVPKRYYAGTAAYGIRGVLGVALYSFDGKSKFTDALAGELENRNSNASTMEGELLPGKSISCDFTLFPYFTDGETQSIAASGDYILKLWYNSGNDDTIETEFPVTIVKRFGRMYLKSQV